MARTTQVTSEEPIHHFPNRINLATTEEMLHQLTGQVWNTSTK